jgi:hypothetical protein
MTRSSTSSYVILYKDTYYAFSFILSGYFKNLPSCILYLALFDKIVFYVDNYLYNIILKFRPIKGIKGLTREIIVGV